MSPRNALASTLNLEFSELTEYEYQPSRTKRRVYAIGDFYYCSGLKPVSLDGIKWEQHSDQFFAKQAKTVIWKGSVDVE